MSKTSRFLVILALVIVVIWLVYATFFKPGNTAAIEAKYQEKKEKLEKEIQSLEIEREKLLKKNEEKEKELIEVQEKGKKKDEKISRLERTIENRPRVVVTDENCKQEYELLYADYEKRGNLISIQKERMELFENEIQVLTKKYDLMETANRLADQQIAKLKQRVNLESNRAESWKKRARRKLVFAVGAGYTVNWSGGGVRFSPSVGLFIGWRLK